MEQKIQELVNISRKFGVNPDYIIAGGGNTSFKTEEKIWVKASGTSMSEINKDGFVCLDRAKLKILSTKKYSLNSSERESQVKNDLAAAILSPKDKRPSVETSMHEIIRFPFIVHTHPTLANGLLCATNSEELVTELFGDEVIYIPYTDPGYILFKAVDNALNTYRKEKGKEPEIIFLENHGVFVGAKSIKDIEKIYTNIEQRLKAKASTLPTNISETSTTAMNALMETIARNTSSGELIAMPMVNDLILDFVKNEDSFSKVAVPFTPDGIVYCKSHYLYLEDETNFDVEFNLFKRKYSYYPKVIALKGKGLIALEESKKSAQIVLDVFFDAMKVSFISENFGGPRPMTQSQIDFIDNWEVENYRRQVSRK